MKDNSDLLIKSADKGGAIVAINGGLHKKLNMELLRDRHIYIPLKNYPTGEYLAIIKSLIE